MRYTQTMVEKLKWKIIYCWLICQKVLFFAGHSSASSSITIDFKSGHFDVYVNDIESNHFLKLKFHNTKKKYIK